MSSIFNTNDSLVPELYQQFYQTVHTIVHHTCVVICYYQLMICPMFEPSWLYLAQNVRPLQMSYLLYTLLGFVKEKELWILLYAKLKKNSTFARVCNHLLETCINDPSSQFMWVRNPGFECFLATLYSHIGTNFVYVFFFFCN